MPSGSLDDVLLRDILSKDTLKVNKALQGIYKAHFSRVKKYVINNSGDLDAAKDLFQDAITVFYQNLLADKYRGAAPLGAYLFSIARNLWLLKLRRRGVPKLELELDIPLAETEAVELNLELIDRIFDRLGSGCRDLLIGFYFRGMSIEDLAEHLGLSSSQGVRTKKFRCMKQLSALVKKMGIGKDRLTR